MSRIPDTEKQPSERSEALAGKKHRGRRRFSLRLNSWPMSFAFAATMGVVAVIGGCAANNNTLNRTLEIIGVDELTLSEETRKQLGRFETAYNTYSAVGDDTDLNYFRFAYRRVQTTYVRDVPDSTLVDAALKGIEKDKPAPKSVQSDKLVETALDSMLQSLDPHSDFLNPEEFRESFVQTKGEFGGLGIEVTMEDGYVKVIAPIEDTPAERAGLKSGDLITHVDGAPIKGKTLTDAVRTMRGPPGSDILLKIKREGTSDFDVTITRAVITVRSVRWRREGDIGYVRVSRFTEKVESGIARAMAELRTGSDGDLKGVILDLRSNPGGLLDQSLILADSFLDTGEIVSVRGRAADDRRVYPASPGDLARGLPMVVLIDGGSASASEIVASALQFHKRAVVMGMQSFGKGSVQTILPLPVEGALRLTTALYYSPSGKTIQAVGVAPDIIIDPEKELETTSEADLPGAFPAQADKGDKGKPHVAEAACPEIGEAKDRQLGCALTFLRAGSTEKFLADIKSKSAI